MVQPCNPAISLLDIFPKELKVGSQRCFWTPMLLNCSIVHSYQEVEAVQMCFSVWMDEENMAHTYNEILSSLKEGNPVICYNMGQPWENYVK